MKHHSSEDSVLEKQKETAEEEKESLFAQYVDLLNKDSVLKEIVGAIKEGWPSLAESKKKGVIDTFRELMRALHEYHDSYIGLKFAAAPERRMVHGEDVEKYKSGIKTADERERILHNAFIDAVNILSRNMKEFGLDNTWRSDERIYGLNPEATREKLKHWMFNIFEERMLDHI